eukprot:scaffold1034_cov418-Prasinococcus_capsulatus_cf.AAC.1
MRQHATGPLCASGSGVSTAGRLARKREHACRGGQARQGCRGAAAESARARDDGLRTVHTSVRPSMHQRARPGVARAEADQEAPIGPRCARPGPPRPWPR